MSQSKKVDIHMKLNDKWAQAYQEYSSRQFQNGMKLFALANPKPNEILLDIGCGTGDLTHQFAEAIQPQGIMIAIDPDVARLKIAKKTQHTLLKNITWKNISIEKYQPPKNHFNIIYANYVLHWINDQKIQRFMLKKIFEALHSNGKFLMQTIVGVPEFIKKITLVMGEEGEKFIYGYNFATSTQWQSMLSETGFKIEKIAPVADYDFFNLEDFLDWWEATTHGIFSRIKIKEHDLNKFKADFNPSIHLYGKETLLLSARKI